MKNTFTLAVLICSDVLLFGLAHTIGGSGTWYLAVAWTLFVLWEAATLLAMPRIVDVERFVSRERGFSGDDVFVTLTVSAKRGWWASLPVRMEEEMDDVLRIRQTYDQPPRRFGHTLRASYTFHALPRGAYALYGLTIECSDLFGLFKRRQTAERLSEWLIYPKIVPLSPDFTASSLLCATRSARSHLFAASEHLSGTRPYMPGDRLGGIHWPATARTQQLQSRTFDIHMSHLTYLWLDEINGDERQRDVFERSVCACASVASALLSAGRLTGLLLVEQTVSPKRGDLQRVRMMDALARAKPCRMNVAEQRAAVHAHLLRTMERDAVLYVFTQTFDDLLVRDLNALLRRNLSVVVFLAQPAGDDSVMDRQGVTVCAYSSLDALPAMMNDGYMWKPNLR